MKKLIILLIVSFCMLFASPALADELEMDAGAAILIDANTGRILFQYNADQQLPPASTTKILTALMVLESIDDLSQTVTLPEDYINIGESGIDLVPGETLVIEDLLYALMLQSANDAAQALAIAVAGDEQTFIQAMNDRTAKLGLENSNWENEHGLDSILHYSTAHDLAMIAREANKIPYFYQLVNAASWTMPWPDNEDDRIFYNHNKFLSEYPGGDGIKTGYTNLANNCLVGSATRDGMQLIGVVLNCPNQTHYQQMALLMDYGFENFKPTFVAAKEVELGSIKIYRGYLDEMSLILAKDAVIALPNGSDFIPEYKIELLNRVNAPIDTDVPVGTITFSDDLGNEGEALIYLQESVTGYTFGGVFLKVWQSFVGVLF